MQKFGVGWPENSSRRCRLSKDPKEMKEHAVNIWEDCARLRDRKA